MPVPLLAMSACARVAEDHAIVKEGVSEGCCCIVALSRNSDLDCRLVCPEFRGVFASWSARTRAPLSWAVCMRGPRLQVARSLHADGPREVSFFFFQRISKCFSNLVLS